MIKSQTQISDEWLGTRETSLADDDKILIECAHKIGFSAAEIAELERLYKKSQTSAESPE